MHEIDEIRLRIMKLVRLLGSVDFDLDRCSSYVDTINQLAQQQTDEPFSPSPSLLQEVTQFEQFQALARDWLSQLIHDAAVLQKDISKMKP